MSDFDKQMEMILYHSDDGDVLVDAYIKDESIWITQKAMAELFGVQVPAISKHLKKIFDEGELEEKGVVSKMEITSRHGAMPDKTQINEAMFYNLDAIISVGYRVNSKKATQFRIWASEVLKNRIVWLKKSGTWIVQENGIDDYNFAGVWAMYGRLNENDEWSCLEVGETSNIKKEIGDSINIIVDPDNKVDSSDCKTKRCFKRFNKKWSKDFSGSRTRYIEKYRDISFEYNEIKVVLTFKNDSISERLKEEARIAINETARYWYPAPTNRNRSEESQWEMVKNIVKIGK